MQLFGLGHGGRVPVNGWFLVAAGAAGSAVAPDFSSSFSDADGFGGLGEVYAVADELEIVFFACCEGLCTCWVFGSVVVVVHCFLHGLEVLQ